MRVQASKQAAIAPPHKKHAAPPRSPRSTSDADANDAPPASPLTAAAASPSGHSQPASSAAGDEAAGPSEGQRAPDALTPAQQVLPRLLHLHSEASLAMPLRPALAVVQAGVQAALAKTLHAQQNNSLLVIGPPGSGKTLVRG